jgi:hypothetical protein
MSELKWRKASDWCLESNKGGYKVTKYMRDGQPIYQAIKGDMSLLVAGNSELCKAACNDDAITAARQHVGECRTARMANRCGQWCGDWESQKWV